MASPAPSPRPRPRPFPCEPSRDLSASAAASSANSVDATKSAPPRPSRPAPDVKRATADESDDDLEESDDLPLTLKNTTTIPDAVVDDSVATTASVITSSDDLVLADDPLNPGKSTILAASFPRLVYMLTHPEKVPDKALLREFLATYNYCTPKKEFAGKTLVDTLRKRWNNEPIGVPEDVHDQVFLGLKNGLNHDHVKLFLEEWLTNFNWEFKRDESLRADCEFLINDYILVVMGVWGYQLKKLLNATKQTEDPDPLSTFIKDSKQSNAKKKPAFTTASGTLSPSKLVVDDKKSKRVSVGAPSKGKEAREKTVAEAGSQSATPPRKEPASLISSVISPRKRGLSTSMAASPRSVDKPGPPRPDSPSKLLVAAKEQSIASKEPPKEVKKGTVAPAPASAIASAPNAPSTSPSKSPSDAPSRQRSRTFSGVELPKPQGLSVSGGSPRKPSATDLSIPPKNSLREHHKSQTLTELPNITLQGDGGKDLSQDSSAADAEEKRKLLAGSSRRQMFRASKGRGLSSSSWDEERSVPEQPAASDLATVASDEELTPSKMKPSENRAILMQRKWTEMHINRGTTTGMHIHKRESSAASATSSEGDSGHSEESSGFIKLRASHGSSHSADASTKPTLAVPSPQGGGLGGAASASTSLVSSSNVAGIAVTPAEKAKKAGTTKKDLRLSAGSRKVKQDNPEFFQQKMSLLDAVDLVYEAASFQSAQLAVQLTMIEQRLFRNITPDEFFFGNWKRPNKDSLCPNIVAMISWFNRMTDWIITEIVTGLTVKRRAKSLKKFINVAAICRDIGNLNTAMEIISALSKSPVVRLKITWSELDEKSSKSYKELHALLDPTTNYTALRALQNKAPTPCLPYIGILLQDLLSMEEIESKQNGLINFKKNRRLAAAFDFILSRQRVPYTKDSFEKDQLPPDYLAPYLLSTDLVVLAENDQYKFSNLAESRDAIKAAGL